MKKTILALACALVAGAAFATGTTAPLNTGSGSVAGSVRGSNTVTSGVSVTSTSGGAGSSSLSYAQNTQAATAQVGVTGGISNVVAPNCDTTLSGNIGITGAVTTSGSSIAYNVSTGAGAYGSASAAGTSLANVSGSGSFTGVNTNGSVNGTVAGAASAQTTTAASAGTNQSAYSAGIAGASFNMSSTATLASTGAVRTTDDCGNGRCGPATADSKTVTTTGVTNSYSDNVTQTGFAITVGDQQVTLSAGQASATTVSGATGTAVGGAVGNVSASLSNAIVPTTPVTCHTGGCGDDDHDKDKNPKGNNGWGNGAEGTNSGSNSGGTAGSKSDEKWTPGDGPKPKKHNER